MSNLMFKLKNSVFANTNESITSLMYVRKPTKRLKSFDKKSSFLCITAGGSNFSSQIHLIKKNEHSDSYKIKYSWRIEELKKVDGHTSEDNLTNVLELDLYFEKQYKWIGGKTSEKNHFLTTLLNLCNKDIFVRIPKILLKQNYTKESDSLNLANEDLIQQTNSTDFKILSEKEDKALEELLSDSDYSISDSEAFIEKLKDQLSKLEAENMTAIMGSEDQVANLMSSLDSAIRYTGELEDLLDKYDSKLQTVRELVDLMQDKQKLLTIRSNNHSKLLETLDELMMKLDFTNEDIDLLENVKLSGIPDVTKAAIKLRKCITARLPDHLHKLEAVSQRVNRLQKLEYNFYKNVSHELNNSIIHERNLRSGKVDSTISFEREIHAKLAPFSQIMSLLKEVNKEAFDSLFEVYNSYMNDVYNVEFEQMFDAVKVSIGYKSERKGITSHAFSPQSSSTTLDRRYSIEESKKFDDIFEQILLRIEPICLKEQSFSIEFFGLCKEPVDNSINEIKHRSLKMSESKSNENLLTVENLGAGLKLRRMSTALKHENDELRGVMNKLFPSLNIQFQDFITCADKLDPMNSLYMLVRMKEHCEKNENAGSFLSQLYATALIIIKRNFSQLITNMTQQHRDQKVPKTKRVGIIWFVKDFEYFCSRAETIFKTSKRRTELNKAYLELIGSIFEHIDRIARENIKSPKDVTIMENFHRVHSVLSQLKVSELDEMKKLAKTKYQESLNFYINMLLGRPMEKLSLFFEKVKISVENGMREEEVGYQLSYGKTELRKLIQLYPGKEVKKGLQSLYAKVEKQLCEEEGLLQVVWRGMQENFIKQYFEIDELIKKCYPGSDIKLEFTIEEDLLVFFSDIAQSH